MCHGVDLCSVQFLVGRYLFSDLHVVYFFGVSRLLEELYVHLVHGVVLMR